MVLGTLIQAIQAFAWACSVYFLVIYTPIIAIIRTTITKGAAIRMMIVDDIINTNILTSKNKVKGMNSSSPAISFENLVKIVPIEFVS